MYVSKDRCALTCTLNKGIVFFLPQRPQSTQRKKNKFFLCVLCVLCGKKNTDRFRTSLYVTGYCFKPDKKQPSKDIVEAKTLGYRQ